METYDLPQIWGRLTDKLSHVISEINMDIYIRQISPVKLENDVLYCTVPSATLRSAIQQNFLTTITTALNEIANTDIRTVGTIVNIPDMESVACKTLFVKYKSGFAPHAFVKLKHI